MNTLLPHGTQTSCEYSQGISKVGSAGVLDANQEGSKAANTLKTRNNPELKHCTCKIAINRKQYDT